MGSEIVRAGGVLSASDLNAIARRTDWDVTWKKVPAGLVDEVDPALKIDLAPIKFGTTGDHVLGYWIKSVTGDIKVEFRQISLGVFEAYTPWGNGSGSILLLPTSPNIDLYAFADLLTLHPHDMPDTSEDMNFLKASPTSLPAAITRNGSKDDVWKLSFCVFPDRDLITGSPGVIAYGWIGDPGSPPDWTAAESET